MNRKHFRPFAMLRATVMALERTQKAPAFSPGLYGWIAIIAAVRGRITSVVTSAGGPQLDGNLLGADDVPLQAQGSGRPQPATRKAETSYLLVLRLGLCYASASLTVQEDTKMTKRLPSKLPIYETIPDAGYMRLPQILRFIPIGRSTFWKWVKDGKAPKGIKLGPKTTVWKAEDIRELIAELDSA